MTCGFAKGNDANDRWRFRMRDRNRYSAQESQCHETLLAVGESVVFNRERRALEHPGRVAEIEPVYSKIRLPLPLVPEETHTLTVYTPGCYVNA